MVRAVCSAWACLIGGLVRPLHLGVEFGWVSYLDPILERSVKRVSFALVGLALIGGSFVQAADEEPKKKRDPEKLFARLDADKDGKLTLAEFVGKREGEKKSKAEAAFARKDKDKDGSLSKEEFVAKPKKKKD